MDGRQTKHKKGKILINMISLFETRPVTWEFDTYHMLLGFPNAFYLQPFIHN